MQDNNAKNSKEVLLKAVGKVIKSFRDKGMSVFYYERGLSPMTMSAIEKGQSDVKITTLHKIAQAFNMTFVQFAKLLEKELPQGFTMLDEN